MTGSGRVSIREVRSTALQSSGALAEAFGAPILEPGWWPADIGEVSAELLGSSERQRYSIGSVRDDGSPIRVIGVLESAWKGRSPRDWLDGEWSEPDAFADLRGLVGWVGIPPRLQVVVYDHGLAIQLIGFRTEDEVVRAVRSFRRIEPGLD